MERNVYDVLTERGYIEQATHADEIRALLGKEKVTFYIGFDPTADSLHVGHYIMFMVMQHMQQHGHRPIFLAGGGTGMIGDPSGRSDMRRVMTVDMIDDNVEHFKKQAERFIDFADGKALLLNNADWLRKLNYIEFLRDYGAYFSQMVQTSVEPVYPIDNYGSAMAPFYSVLAIWVGGVMLVAILKPHARREGLVAPKPYQLFFGRYFLFFALSQIQAAVIVAGDLLVLKIQCVEPALLFATGAITSLVFSLLIYSLTISFGDVGKAIVVVVMVLQIAGSSGTFPIELLPDVYQKIYHIFPFPYAIDAMRECICGLYGLTWLKNIGCLLIFGAAALLIGLWVRKPFMGLNHFMEEKLEETEML